MSDPKITGSNVYVPPPPKPAYKPPPPPPPPKPKPPENTFRPAATQRAKVNLGDDTASANVAAAKAGLSANASLPVDDPELAAPTPPETLEEAQEQAEVARENAAAAQANAAEDPEAAEAAEAAANDALDAMNTANAMAEEQGYQSPYPMAEDVPDATAAARLSQEDQVALFGAPLALTTEAVVASDVAALESAADPGEAAVQLEAMLTHASPEYREALLATPEAQAALAGYATWQPGGEGGESYQAGIDALTRLSEAMGPEQALLLTDPIARAWPEGGVGNATFAQALRGSMNHTNPLESMGFTFTMAMEQSFRAAGRAPQADEMRGYAMEAMRYIDGEFARASGEVDALQQELYLYLQEFGPAMTEEQRQAAIDGFMAQHQDVYSQWETLGARMTGVMEAMDAYGLESAEGYDAWRVEFAEQLPKLGMTSAGSAYLETAVQRAANGQTSILDLVPQFKDVDGYSNAMTSLLMNASGRVLGDLVNAGNTAEAENLLRRLGFMADVAGIPREQLDPILNDLANIVSNPGATPDETLTRLEQEFKDIGEAFPGSVLGGALKGLALAAATFGVAQGFGGWGDATTQDRLSTVVNAAELSGDMLFTYMSAVRGVSTEAIERVAGRVFTALGVGLDVWNAVDAFSAGNAKKGVGHTAAAIGGVVMIMAGSNPVGLLIGGTLLVGGSILAAVGGNEEKRRQAREKFLTQAGVDPAAIPTLVHATEGRVEELVAMGLSYEQIIDLAKRSPFIFTQADGNGVSVEPLANFQQQTGMSGDEMYALMDAAMKAAPGEEEGALYYLVQIFNTAATWDGSPDVVLADLDSRIADLQPEPNGDGTTTPPDEDEQFMLNILLAMRAELTEQQP